MVPAIGFEPMHKSVMSRLPYHLAKRTGFREVSLSDRKGFYQWTSHRALSSWCLERDSNPHLMDFKSSASAVGLPRHLTGARSIAPERWRARSPNYERRWFRLCCFYFFFFLLKHILVFVRVQGFGYSSTFRHPIHSYTEVPTANYRMDTLIRSQGEWFAHSLQVLLLLCSPN